MPRAEILSPSRRAAMVVEAVERAAEGIIDEAENEARRYVEDARKRADDIAATRTREAFELVEALTVCAERLRTEMDGLIDVLGDTRSRLAGALDGEPSKDSQPQRGAEVSARRGLRGLRPVFGSQTEDSASEGEEDRDVGPVDSTRFAGARLLATQMAMAGTPREKVQACLEVNLSPDEVSPILEAVFGPEA